MRVFDIVKIWRVRAVRFYARLADLLFSRNPISIDNPRVSVLDSQRVFLKLAVYLFELFLRKRYIFAEQICIANTTYIHRLYA